MFQIIQSLRSLKSHKWSCRDEKGQGLVEYALIIGLVAVVVIVALPGVADSIKEIFTHIAGKLSGAVPTE